MNSPEQRALARRTLLAGAAAGAGSVWVEAGKAAAVARGRGPVTQAAVDAEVARVEQRLIALRRDLHRHPEAAPGQERRTAAVVAR